MVETSIVPADHLVVVSGRVTEVDLRYTQNGTPVLLLGLAGEDGRPYYLQVKALRGRAEYWADRLRKGAPVLAEATLSQYKGQDGRTYTSLLARRLELVDPRAVGESAPDARGNTREVPGLNLFVGRGVAVRVEGRTPTLAVVRARFVTGGRRDGRGYAPAAFVDVKAFDEVARELSRVREGQPFFVQGRLRVDSWDGKEGRRYQLRVEALFVKPLLREAGGALGEGKGELDEFPPEEDLPF
jgi:single-stranded DNA-binding protein